jgi:hypothetical protein
MQEKHIKRMVIKQLKKQFPNWGRLTRKEKKTLAEQVLAEVKKSCPPASHISAPLNELTGTPSIKDTNIMTLSDMERFIREHNRCVVTLPAPSRKKYLKDPELRAIDALLDNSIIDKLLAPVGFTPARRLLFPFHMLRAELLKCLKHAELSYRKYCAAQLNNLEQKTNRAFVGLPLHKKLSISHSQLSQFRASLTFSQLVNLLVYIIHLFLKSGRLNSRFVVHGVDSAELAAVCNPTPLATIEAGKNKQVRIYAELDADCGTRRKKRDKSAYFVGYRLHTLTAINPQTGHSYPLISLIAPGNHHDNLFLTQLIQLGQAIGLELKVVIADEGYGDAADHEAIQTGHGITVITPPKSKIKLPKNVDPLTQAVYQDKWCEHPMIYLGKTEAGLHEFSCNASPGECIRYLTCHQHREIPTDSGIFGQIPAQIEGVEELNNLRKNLERPFNLLKHREGLEPVRVRSQQGLMAVATFANMANLLLEIVATRKTKRKENRQLQLKPAA